MFSNEDKLQKERFIELYEEFISNPQDKSTKEKAGGMGILGGPQLSDDVDKAAQGAYKIAMGSLSIDEAKKILKSLKESRGI